MRAVNWLHPDSVSWTKHVFVLLDLVTTALLVGLLVRARIRPERVLLACATLIKRSALIALPAFSSPRRTVRLLAGLLATTALAYAPFLSVGAHVLGFLPGYVRQEGITSGERYYLLHQATWPANRLPGNPAALLARSPLALISATNWYEAGILAAMMACVGWCWLRPALSVQDICSKNWQSAPLLLLQLSSSTAHTALGCYQSSCSSCLRSSSPRQSIALRRKPRTPRRVKRARKAT